jgi:hypothetical protein
LLIFANGAPKSGSTWLLKILELVHTFDPIPPLFEHPNIPGWLNPVHYRRFVKMAGESETWYLTKSHIFEVRTRDLLLGQPGVLVFNMDRDPRDALVSHYYHVKREGKFIGPFNAYYWLVGRFKSMQLAQYKRVWGGRTGRVFETSFETLKGDFEREVLRIGTFLEVPMPAERVEQIKKDTTIEALRRSSGESVVNEEKRFFRRGEIGGWMSYFNPAMLNDLERIYAGQVTVLDRAAYGVLFQLRPAIKNFFYQRSSLAGPIIGRF